MLKSWIEVFSTLLPGLIVISLVGVGLAVGRRRATPQSNAILLGGVAFMLFALAAARIALLTLIDVTSFPVLYIPYMSPLYPPLLLGIGVGIYLLVTSWRPAAKKQLWPRLPK